MNEPLTENVKVGTSNAPRPPEHLQTAERLTRTVVEGAATMPAERPMLVCKPNRVKPWRVFKIMAEFVEGFDVIRKYTLAATFFGSARASFGDEVYQHATELAGRLAKQGFAVITGGSSGVMQAANRGAFEAGGESIGLNINLKDVQPYNPYLTERFGFDHFFVRKVMLTYASEVYVYFPGGYGTLDEFFEIVTLVQTKKIRRVPIILFDKEYWTPLIEFLTNKVYKEHGAIDAADLELFTLVDTVDEAYDYIIKNASC